SFELRAQHALNARHYAEAVDILSRALNDTPDEEKKGIFLILGLAQQRAGNVTAAKAAYEQAARQSKRELAEIGSDSGPGAELHSFLGLAYAGLGEKASAVAEGQKGMALQPSSEDPFEGHDREEAMAEIYALLDDAD